MAHMRQVGPVHVEPVSVGIFLKRARSFAELRPMTKWVALSFSLPRPAGHKLIKRKVINYNGRYYHVANVARPEQSRRRPPGVAYRGVPEFSRMRYGSKYVVSRGA